VFLVIMGLVPKIGQVVANVPGPVIGGAATVMFAMVTAVGIRTLNKASFENNHNLLIVAVSLSAGLIPAVAPSFYEKFPSDFQVIFGSSITSAVIVVFTLNLVFNHWTWHRPQEDDAVDEALAYGAVAVDVPDGGVNPRGADGQQPGSGGGEA
jgi:uric acid transporter